MSRGIATWRAVAFTAAVAAALVVAVLIVTQPSYTTVSFHDIRIDVPKNWLVENDVEVDGVCVSGSGRSTVALETRPRSTELFLCPAVFFGDPHTLSLEVKPLPQPAPSSLQRTPMRVGTLGGELVEGMWGGRAEYPMYVVDLPSEEAQLVFWGNNPKLRSKILSSVRVANGVTTN